MNPIRAFIAALLFGVAVMGAAQIAEPYARTAISFLLTVLGTMGVVYISGNR